MGEHTAENGADPAASHWTSWPPMDDGPILTDEEQIALVTAVRVQQVARIITRDTGAPEDAAMTAAWSLARVGLLATPGRHRPEPPVTADHTPERLDLTRLREVAEAAPEGRWNTPCDIYGLVAPTKIDGYVDPDGRAAAQARTAAACEHIATFDPPTILALLDTIAALRAERDALREFWHTFWEDVATVECACGLSAYEHEDMSRLEVAQTKVATFYEQQERVLYPQDPDQERTSG